MNYHWPFVKILGDLFPTCLLVFNLFNKFSYIKMLLRKGEVKQLKD